MLAVSDAIRMCGAVGLLPDGSDGKAKTSLEPQAMLDAGVSRAPVTSCILLPFAPPQQS